MTSKVHLKKIDTKTTERGASAQVVAPPIEPQTNTKSSLQRLITARLELNPLSRVNVEVTIKRYSNSSDTSKGDAHL